MTDEDARLRRLLASVAQAPEDDAFVARVEERMKRARRKRRRIVIGLVLATGISLVVLAPFVVEFGVLIARGTVMASRGATSVLLSPAGAMLGLVVGLAYLVTRRR
jgi:hypothetical protein